MVEIPWETTGKYIRSGHNSPEDFQQDSLRTITISEEQGIKAVVGKPKGKDTMEVQTYLFNKNKWTLKKAKAWFQKHQESKVHEHISFVLPFKVLEKIVDQPLRIQGVALTSGMSRNLNIYTPEELENFAGELISSPVYVEHVAVPNAIGKVTKTEWDGDNIWYEAEIYDQETAEKIRKGLIQHVSVGADYQTLDILDGKVPHGLHNAELSLVAVPGIPETNLQILEKAPARVSQVERWLKEREKMTKIEEQDGEIKPGEGESHEDFMNRCLASGREREECTAVWKQVHPEEETEGQVKEAEWDQAYINDLADSCFAVIEPGGEKDEDGKTKPRNLRHLPFKNKQGNIDEEHLRNALGRLPQTELSDQLKNKAKKKLCAAVRSWNQEHEDKIQSDVCNIEAEEKLEGKVAELYGRVEKLEEALGQGNVAESLLKGPKEPTVAVSKVVKMIEDVIPSKVVVNSLGQGQQRFIQELRGVLYKLQHGEDD